MLSFSLLLVALAVPLSDSLPATEVAAALRAAIQWTATAKEMTGKQVVLDETSIGRLGVLVVAREPLTAATFRGQGWVVAGSDTDRVRVCRSAPDGRMVCGVPSDAIVVTVADVVRGPSPAAFSAKVTIGWQAPATGLSHFMQVTMAFTNTDGSWNVRYVGPMKAV
jgi:hypothetical protein